MMRTDELRAHARHLARLGVPTWPLASGERFGDNSHTP